MDVVAVISTIGQAALIGVYGVESVSDLQGQSVLMTTSTSMDYILDRSLVHAGLMMGDIVTDEVPALPTRLEMLLHDQAAGARYYPTRLCTMPEGSHADA